MSENAPVSENIVLISESFFKKVPQSEHTSVTETVLVFENATVSKNASLSENALMSENEPQSENLSV